MQKINPKAIMIGAKTDRAIFNNAPISMNTGTDIGLLRKVDPPKANVLNLAQDRSLRADTYAPASFYAREWRHIDESKA